MENYFNGYLDINKIPSQKLVKIYGGEGVIHKTQSGVEVPLILEDDKFAVKAKSSFGSMADPKSNTLLNLLSGATGGKIPSGQFALQAMQIWESTEPLEFEFSTLLYMRDDGYNDVVFPIKTLMKTCLPRIANSGLGAVLQALIPPGPNLTNILSMLGASNSFTEDMLTQGNMYNVQIGKFQFNNCIITGVEPSFSTIVDDNGYPTSAECNITIRTSMVATQDMVENMI